MKFNELTKEQQINIINQDLQSIMESNQASQFLKNYLIYWFENENPECEQCPTSLAWDIG